jgi:hypothetical protein
MCQRAVGRSRRAESTRDSKKRFDLNGLKHHIARSLQALAIRELRKSAGGSPLESERSGRRSDEPDGATLRARASGLGVEIPPLEPMSERRFASAGLPG